MREFDQEEWEKKCDAFTEKHRAAGYAILKAVMLGALLGLVLLHCGVNVGSAAVGDCFFECNENASCSNGTYPSYNCTYKEKIGEGVYCYVYVNSSYLCGDATGDGVVDDAFDRAAIRDYVRFGVPLNCTCPAFSIEIEISHFDLSDYDYTCPPMPESWIDVGSNWIEWNWNFTNATVFLDGVIAQEDNDLKYYVLSDLNPNEKHRIDVFDNDNETVWYSDAVTTNSLFVVFLVVAFIIGCICLGLLVSIFPLVGFIPATGLLIYLIENNFEGWVILFVGFLWIICLVFGGECLLRDYRRAWRSLKRK